MRPGIFCLEGEWTANLADRVSVRPGLDMLTTVTGRRLVHRNAVTRSEFEHYFRTWATARYRGYRLAYLSYHGSKGHIGLADEQLSIDDIAGMAAGALTGRVVYFGSCATMGARTVDLVSFCEHTGADAVVGYTKNVDWAESSAFDFTLLPELLEATDMKKLFDRLTRRHPWFVQGLGLRLATRNWALPEGP